jgi:hypothetical protein
MTSGTSASSSEGFRAEAERQLGAVAERHREAVGSMARPGRPEAGQYVAIKVVGRAVGAVSFALRRAAEAGVPFERLVELTGWEPDLVRAALEQAVPAPRVVARLTPPGVDAGAVAQAAAGFEAISRLREFTQRVLADVELDLEAETRAPLGPEDLEDLHDRLETAWRSWHDGLAHRAREGG